MSIRNAVRALGIAIMVASVMPARIAAAQAQGQQGQGQGQGQQQGQPNRITMSDVRVHLKLVVEKLDKDKVTNTIPFELVVRPGKQTTLNHGKSVVVPQTTTTREGIVQTSYTQMSIGSNIAVMNLVASELTAAFDLMLDISSVDSTSNPGIPGSQNFKKMSISSAIAVRLGEPSVVSVSNDQLSGETVRLTVTATFVK